MWGSKVAGVLDSCPALVARYVAVRLLFVFFSFLGFLMCFITTERKTHFHYDFYFSFFVLLAVQCSGVLSRFDISSVAICFAFHCLYTVTICVFLT